MTTLTWSGRTLSLAPGQTVLDALEAAGTAPSASCRAGVCQSCLVRAVDGTVPARAQEGLTPGQKARGVFKACVCIPAEALQLVPADAEDAPLPGILVARERRGTTAILDLHVPGLTCLGGQFVNVIRADGLTRPYSVATRWTDHIRLHVAILPDGRMSRWLADAPIGTPLQVRGPAGDCVYVDEPDRPLVLAGLGTGLAPLLGILDDADQAGHHAPVHLYFGARTATDLYWADNLRERAARTPRLHLHLGALDAQEQPGIHSGPLEDAVLANKEGLARGRHYLCGAPAWVQSLQRRLFLGGASLQRIHADAFVTAPP